MSFFPIFKPLLFAMDPERAHRMVVRAVAGLNRLPGVGLLERGLYGYDHAALRQTLWGLDFPNPVGMAAGFDKNAELVSPLLALGLGLLEVGTVTPRPQAGNPRPRLFRLPADEALINRMGFNSEGAYSVAGRLGKVKYRPAPVGINLGKNLDTPVEEAAADYLTAMHALFPMADYLVINISSPNTPGLRGLQEKSAVEGLLTLLCREKSRLAAASDKPVPMLLKISPNLEEGALEDLVGVAMATGIDGMIAVNTTTERTGLSDPAQTEAGGLSGRPLHQEALRTIRELYRLSSGKMPLVGVGGIFSPEDAYAMIRAGASLVQVYSGLIYNGPAFPKKLKQGLVRLLREDGLDNITQAIGTEKPKKRGGGNRKTTDSPD